MRNVDMANKIATSLYRPKTCPVRIAILMPIEDRSLYSLDPKSDWGPLSSVGVEVYFVPGRGGAMFDQPHVKVLGTTFNNSGGRRWIAFDL